METDYDRAWRERGEAEAALRQWRNNQSSPTMIKTISTFAGLVGATLFCLFVREPSWDLAPALIFATMFYAMPFLSASMLRDEEQQREEARATLSRLGLWKGD